MKSSHGGARGPLLAHQLYVSTTTCYFIYFDHVFKTFRSLRNEK